MKDYNISQPQQESAEPFRALTVASDAGVPFAWAIISGALVGAIIVLLALLFRLDELLDTRGWLLLFGIPCLITTLAVWAWGIRTVINSTIQKLETIWGVDLPGGGEPERPHMVTVNTGKSLSKVEEEKARMLTFVDMLYLHGTGYRTLRDTGFTDAEIEYRMRTLRQPNIGIVGWKNQNDHKQGVRLLKTHDEARAIVATALFLEPAKVRK